MWRPHIGFFYAMWRPHIGFFYITGAYQRLFISYITLALSVPWSPYGTTLFGHRKGSLELGYFR
jgi:hypothetical protein